MNASLMSSPHLLTFQTDKGPLKVSENINLGALGLELGQKLKLVAPLIDVETE